MLFEHGIIFIRGWLEKTGQQDMVLRLMNQLPWSLLIQHRAESDFYSVIYFVLFLKK